MPNKIIKESIKRSPEIDSLSWFEEVVFYRLLVTADDYGCLDGRTVVLKNELFPTKDTITKKAIDDAISALARVGLVRRYIANGAPYLFLPTWELHQRVRNKHRKYPAPILDSELLSNDCQTTATCMPESNPIRIQSDSESNSNVCTEPEPVSMPTVITIILNDKSDYPIKQDKVNEWASLFPAVDVLQELREMKAWCNDNPTKRKTKAGILRFVNSWLSREQDKGGVKNRPVRNNTANAAQSSGDDGGTIEVKFE